MKPSNSCPIPWSVNTLKQTNISFSSTAINQILLDACRQIALLRHYRPLLCPITVRMASQTISFPLSGAFEKCLMRPDCEAIGIQQNIRTATWPIKNETTHQKKTAVVQRIASPHASDAHDVKQVMATSNSSGLIYIGVLHYALSRIYKSTHNSSLAQSGV